MIIANIFGRLFFMETIYFVYDKQPLSHNHLKLTEYKTEIANCFTRNFSSVYTNYHFDSSVDLQTEILYMVRAKRINKVTDIDNVSKPIIDAFKGIIYDDDGQVVRRIATRYWIESYGLPIFDVTSMPFAVSKAIQKAIDNGIQHVVVVKIKEADLKSSEVI